MGHQGIAVNDMCEEDKIEGLHHALDSNVPESNSHGEDEDQNCRSIVNQKFFRPMS